MPIVTPSGKKSDAEIFLSEFRKKYFPNRILVVSEEGGELERQAEMIPVIKSKIAQNGKGEKFHSPKLTCGKEKGEIFFVEGEIYQFSVILGIMAKNVCYLGLRKK